MSKTAGVSRLVAGSGPKGSLTVPRERQRISVLSKGKFGRKIKPDLTCQASPNYSLLCQFLSVAPAGNGRKESLVALSRRSIARRGCTRNGWGGYSTVQRVWSNGFCNDLEHCVSNYGSNNLIFGTGTRVTITPSKYIVLGQEISYSLIYRSPV